MRFFLGLILGVILGACLGLLVAPQAGAETRRIIRERVGRSPEETGEE